MKLKRLSILLSTVALTGCAGFGLINISEAEADGILNVIETNTDEIKIVHFSATETNDDTVTSVTLTKDTDKDYTHFLKTVTNKKDNSMLSYLDAYQFVDESNYIVWIKENSFNANPVCYAKLTNGENYKAAVNKFSDDASKFAMGFAMFAFPSGYLGMIRKDYTNDYGYQTSITYSKQIVGNKLVVEASSTFVGSNKDKADFDTMGASIIYKDNFLESGSITRNKNNKVESYSFTGIQIGAGVDCSRPTDWKNIVK